jgi:hypothetical protein
MIASSRGARRLCESRIESALTYYNPCREPSHAQGMDRMGARSRHCQVGHRENLPLNKRKTLAFTRQAGESAFRGIQHS